MMRIDDDIISEKCLNCKNVCTFCNKGYFCGFSIYTRDVDDDHDDPV